jgi:rhamnosyltransferase
LRFAVVVVTYYPDKNVLDNLRSIAESGARLIVVDNTPIPIVPAFEALPGTMVVRPGKNIGLAAALNLGVRRAGEEGYEDIFLFDQDSRPSRDFFSNMLLFKRAVDDRTDDCALYASNFYDRNSRAHARFPLFTRWTFRRRTCARLRGGLLHETVMAITSGTLIAYSKYLKTGPFREDYFIDGIDTEYCLRIGRLGFRSSLNCRATLDHALGNRVIRKFLGLTLRPSFHDASRRYYEARNGIRTALDYFADFPLYLPLFLAGIIQESLSICLYEPDKARKIRALLAGLLHGLSRRLGECSLSWLRT